MNHTGQGGAAVGTESSWPGLVKAAMTAQLAAVGLAGWLLVSLCKRGDSTWLVCACARARLPLTQQYLVFVQITADWLTLPTSKYQQYSMSCQAFKAFCPWEQPAGQLGGAQLLRPHHHHLAFISSHQGVHSTTEPSSGQCAHSRNHRRDLIPVFRWSVSCIFLVDCCSCYSDLNNLFTSSACYKLKMSRISQGPLLQMLEKCWKHSLSYKALKKNLLAPWTVSILHPHTVMVFFS